jgi:hypothetical protein
MIIFLVLTVLAADFITAPPNPFAAPSLISLGSGVISDGGFCGALPVAGNN